MLLFFLPWETDLRKHCYNLCQRMFCLCSLIVSCLIFKSLSHFEFIFVYGVCVLTSLIYIHLSNFSNSICRRGCLFSIVYSCLLCQRLIEHSVCVYFWALYSVPLIHMSVFVPIPCCFDYCSFVVLSEVWEGYASYFVLFPQDCFYNSGSLMVQ